MEEQKRYRNSFILMTLVGVAGILVGLYLYEYTDFFAALRGSEGTVLAADPDVRELMLLFCDEVRILALVFLFGLTLFAPYVSVITVAYKGFMTGFSVLYFGMHYECGAIDKRCFVLISAATVLTLTLYVIGTAKSIAFSGSLRYAAPDLPSLLKRRSTGRYLIVFLLLCCFLFLTVTAKYYIPLL